MTNPASGYIPDVIFIGLWGSSRGLASAFGWYSVPNESRTEQRQSPSHDRPRPRTALNPRTIRPMHILRSRCWPWPVVASEQLSRVIWPVLPVVLRKGIA